MKKQTAKSFMAEILKLGDHKKAVFEKKK